MLFRNIPNFVLTIFLTALTGAPSQAEMVNEGVVAKFKAAVVACAGHQSLGRDLTELAAHGFTGSRRKNRWGVDVANPTIIGPSTIGVQSRRNLCRVTVTPGGRKELKNLLALTEDVLRRNGYTVQLKKINYYIARKQYLKNGQRLNVDAGTRIQYGVTTMEVILKKAR